MFPALSMHDQVYTNVGNPELSTNFRTKTILIFGILVAFSDFQNLGFRKLVSIYGLTPVMAKFGILIRPVIFGSTGKKMFRVATDWIVAMVANKMPFRYRPVFYYPCNPMSSYGFTTNSKPSISIFKFGAYPIPTFSCGSLFNVLEKAKYFLWCEFHTQSGYKKKRMFMHIEAAKVLGLIPVTAKKVA